MDALIIQVVSLRSELREVATRITRVEEAMLEAGARCPVDTGSNVEIGGEVEMWESAVSWISILLPMLRSPVVAFGLLIWGSFGRTRGRALVAALAMMVADPVGAMAWLSALAGEAAVGFFRRRHPGGAGGAEGGQPEELPEVGGVPQDLPPPPARPWYVRAFLGAVNGVMAGNPA